MKNFTSHEVNGFVYYTAIESVANRLEAHKQGGYTYYKLKELDDGLNHSEIKSSALIQH